LAGGNFELHAPTNTRSVPTENDSALGHLGYERANSHKARLHQTEYPTPKSFASRPPCPPRRAGSRAIAGSGGGFQSTREGLGRLFHSIPSGPNLGHGCDCPSYVVRVCEFSDLSAKGTMGKLNSVSTIGNRTDTSAGLALARCSSRPRLTRWAASRATRTRP
jgi:hypothetical protein